jgi:cyclase
VLLNSNNGLVKTVKFNHPKYIGDPINAIKIFNDKEVDELIFLDINATRLNQKPNFSLIKEIATECFMPICYGGGITSLEEIHKILYSGIEKVSINTAAYSNPNLIKQAANQFGNQSIVVSIDVKKNWRGKQYVYINNGTKNTNETSIEFAQKMEDLGAGELLINSIDKDGTYSGYDLDLIQAISEKVTIPIIACGGASAITDFKKAVEKGASAVAAGSMFVYYGELKSVLINYPSEYELDKLYDTTK